jgi:LacI family transcriptional regulator
MAKLPEPGRMHARVTLQDVARAAGVSPATVDRVINNRDGVRARTREAVMAAAHRLGYLGEAARAGPPGPSPRPVDLVFLLPAGTNSFIAHLAAQLRAQAAAREGVRARVEMIEGFDPATLAASLRALVGQADGVAVIAIDHPLVRDAIRALVASGTPVLTLVSDVLNVPRFAYVGIDNRQAGRLAGHLMGRFLGRGASGKVALFAGSLSYRGHEEREAGFRHALREMSPDLEIVEVREVQDNRDIARREALATLDRHPDLAAIYSVGGGSTGIAAALTERGVAGRVVLITHEATERSRPYVLDGTIDALIDQNPRVEAREALNALEAAARGSDYRIIQPRIQVVFPENFPED